MKVKFLLLASVLNLATAVTAKESPLMSEEEVIARLNVIDGEMRVKTSKLFRQEILAHENIINEIPKVINTNDEVACKKKRISACEKIENIILALAEKEFEKAGISRYSNEFETYYNYTSDEIEALRKSLHNEIPSEKYEKAELKVRYVLSKAQMHERSTTAYVLGSMVVYKARISLDERYILTAEQLVVEAKNQTENLKDLQNYVLDEDISYLN